MNILIYFASFIFKNIHKMIFQSLELSPNLNKSNQQNTYNFSNQVIHQFSKIICS